MHQDADIGDVIAKSCQVTGGGSTGFLGNGHRSGELRAEVLCPELACRSQAAVVALVGAHGHHVHGGDLKNGYGHADLHALGEAARPVIYHHDMGHASLIAGKPCYPGLVLLGPASDSWDLALGPLSRAVGQRTSSRSVYCCHLVLQTHQVEKGEGGENRFLHSDGLCSLMGNGVNHFIPLH